MRLLVGLTLLFASAAVMPAARKTLDFYFVDVEGGQATLIVAPSGQSILVDSGWPGFNGRDADRIKAAAKAADIDQIDYYVNSHYHTDHVGGVAQLVDKVPVKTFVDHGPNIETGKGATEMSGLYEKALATGKRLTVKPGDTVPVKGLQMKIVTANGERINASGPKNTFCGDKTYPEDKTENARSVGFVLEYGKFRFLDLGDLTSAKEMDLVCPENRVGKIDLYLTTHHGLNTSNAPEIVHAIGPRVAVMNNGAKKGGSPEAWQTIRKAPGLEDIWQVHFAMAGGKENNAADPFIANLEPACEGHYIKVSANQDGSFTVFNSRNKYQKAYSVRK
jgi:competence protein ComEC